jgi:hypothetical protein
METEFKKEDDTSNITLPENGTGAERIEAESQRAVQPPLPERETVPERSAIMNMASYGRRRCYPARQMSISHHHRYGVSACATATWSLGRGARPRAMKNTSLFCRWWPSIAWTPRLLKPGSLSGHSRPPSPISSSTWSTTQPSFPRDWSISSPPLGGASAD